MGWRPSKAGRSEGGERKTEVEKISDQVETGGTPLNGLNRYKRANTRKSSSVKLLTSPPEAGRDCSILLSSKTSLLPEMHDLHVCEELPGNFSEPSLRLI
jgi:hypothetical protein